MVPKNSANAYEEVRKQRLEENKKRMEELNLVALSNSFSEKRNSANKPTPQRNVKPRTPKLDRGHPVSVRRSSRVANIPPPDYREAPIDIPYVRRSYGRRLFSVRCASSVERQEAIETAAMIESELGSTHPIFLKPMLHSHVSGGFWLGLPTHFCSIHMPKHDEWMILEDENGEDSKTLFLSGKTGLSAGWRGFSIEHHLEDGDCLVFQLVQPTRFKVYIVRAAGSESTVTSEEQANNTENLQNEADNPAEEQPNNAEDLQQEADNPDRELQEHEVSNLGKRKRPFKAGKKASKNAVKTGDGKLSKNGNGKERASDAKDGKKVLKKSGKVNDENGSHKSKTKGQNNKLNKKTDADANAESGGNKKLTNMLQTRKSTRGQNHMKTSGAPSPMVMVQA